MLRQLRQAMAIAITLLLTGFFVSPAFAHAILEQSSPANGTTVTAGHTTFTLTFNSRIDQVRSLLVLTLPDHSKQTLKIAASTAPNILTTSADLVPGSCVLHWQVLSVDGHITRGQFSFTVTGQ